MLLFLNHCLKTWNSVEELARKCPLVLLYLSDPFLTNSNNNEFNYKPGSPLDLLCLYSMILQNINGNKIYTFFKMFHFFSFYL